LISIASACCFKLRRKRKGNRSQEVGLSVTALCTFSSRYSNARNVRGIRLEKVLSLHKSSNVKSFGARIFRDVLTKGLLSMIDRAATNEQKTG
jgi:hypothetical protein